MIVFALSLLQAQAALPQSSPETDVVVIGKRLAAWQGRVSTTIGITTCKTTISTGDREIDNVGCMALKRCWSQYRPALSSARKLKVRDEGEARKIEGDLEQCLKSSRDTLVEQLVESRHGMKS